MTPQPWRPGGRDIREAPLNHQRALIIDDEDDIREVVAFSLELMEGWEVLTAPSGPAGILIAQAKRPDVILLDVMMPGMDGKETFAALQSHDTTRGIPVVFLTAKVQPSDRQAYLQLGVLGAISKPFDPLTLAAEMLAFMSPHCPESGPQDQADEAVDVNRHRRRVSGSDNDPDDLSDYTLCTG